MPTKPKWGSEVNSNTVPQPAFKPQIKPQELQVPAQSEPKRKTHIKSAPALVAVASATAPARLEKQWHLYFHAGRLQQAMAALTALLRNWIAHRAQYCGLICRLQLV